MDNNNECCYQKMLEVTTILKEQGESFWIDQGTLLGIIREGAFIPWDWDIDFSAVFTTESRVKYLQSCFEKAGFYVRYIKKSQALRLEPRRKYFAWRHIDIHFHRKVGDSYETYFYDFRENSTPHKMLLKLVVFFDWLERNWGNAQPSRHQVAFEHTSPVKRKKQNLIAAVTGRICYRMKNFFYSLRIAWFTDYVKVTTPACWFDKQESHEFMGITLNVPVQSHDYLAFKYGEHWRTPDRHYDWHNDGAVTVA